MKKIKNIFSCMLVAVLTATMILADINVQAAEYSMNDALVFTYNSSSKVYTAVISSNYKNVLNSLNTTELVIPDIYNDGTNGEAPVIVTSLKGTVLNNTTFDDMITKITFGVNCNDRGGNGWIKVFTALETVVYKYSGTDFNLKTGCFKNSPNTLNSIYFNATDMTLDYRAFATICKNENAKIYVKSDDIKNKIVEVTSQNATYSVPAEMIEIISSEQPVLSFKTLNEALAKADTYKDKEDIYTSDSYKALFDMVKTANAIKSNAEITQAVVDSAEILLTYAINQLTLKGFSELDPLIAQADDLVNNHYDEYWIVPMSSLEVALEKSKELRQNESALQTEINERVRTLKEHIDKVLENKIDIPSLIDELNQIILKAEELDVNDYTKESYAELTKVLNSAKVYYSRINCKRNKFSKNCCYKCN